MAKPEDFTVLVVDDEDDIRRFLSVALEDAGFEVITAENGKEALEKVKANRPDFISLDLVMPGGSGIAFLHELRRNKDWIHIPVMVVTGHARDELGKVDLDNALEGKLLSGPGMYLEKPVTPQKYVGAVMKSLGMEPAEPPEPSAEELSAEVKEALKGMPPHKLQEVLALLKQK